MKARWIALALLLAVSTGVLVLVLGQEMNTPLGETLAPLFSLFGKPVKTADRLFSRVVPLGEIDEKMLGQTLAARMSLREGGTPFDRTYVHTLGHEAGNYGVKAFEYQIFLVDGPANAFALPGGVILVTTGLLNTLTSEAQLMSVLAHEVGHVERGHCFDGARFEMLQRKLGGKPLGELADAIFGVLVHTSFSKTQEEEADSFGFDVMTASGYAPSEMSVAFANLQKSEGHPDSGEFNPFRDYFTSHPPLPLRIENYRERAKRWRSRNLEKTLYVGVRNYNERRPRSAQFFEEEALR